MPNERTDHYHRQDNTHKDSSENVDHPPCA